MASTMNRSSRNRQAMWKKVRNDLSYTKRVSNLNVCLIFTYRESLGRAATTAQRADAQSCHHGRNNYQFKTKHDMYYKI